MKEIIKFSQGINKEGRDFWKEHGFTFTGVFDLNENSDSMKILKAYVSRKNN